MYTFRELTKKEQKIVDYLNDIEDSELVAIHNEFIQCMRYDEDWIYSMEELDDIWAGRKPLEILNDVSDDFNPNHDWVKFNGYGQAVSSYWAIDLVEDVTELRDIAKYCVENDDGLGDCGIRDILDEDENNN